MILGWFTDTPSRRGRGGMSTPGSGLAAHTCRLESALELAGLAVLDGAGHTGDLIGITATQFITMRGTTPEAAHSTTGTISTGEGPAVDFVRVQMRVTGRPMRAQSGAAACTTVLVQRSGLSAETRELLEDTLLPAVRRGRVRALSADTAMADKQGAFRRVEESAPVAERRAEGELVAVVAGITSRRFGRSRRRP